MALLDRYLKDVARWLPAGRAADIVAELRADIQEEMDDRRASLGRDLTTSDEEAILTRWGHPMLVASRYQTQDPFIGPALLPTYYFVLKMVAGLYLLPWFLFWLAVNLFGHAWGIDTTPSLTPLLVQALVLFALITAGFAAVDRSQRRAHTLEKWTARDLTMPGKPRDWREKSRTSAMFDLAIDVAVVSWWLGLAGGPATYLLDPAVRLTMPFAQAPMFWAVLALLLAGIGMSIADVLHPRWTARRLGLQIAMDIAAVAVGVVLMTYSIIEIVPGAATDLAKSATLVEWVNLSWRWTIGIVVVVLAGRIARNIGRRGRVNSVVTVPAA